LASSLLTLACNSFIVATKLYNNLLIFSVLQYDSASKFYSKMAI
jgi:hypothetical protein